MTWHQWHHTASRSRITKRFSAVARGEKLVAPTAPLDRLGCEGRTGREAADREGKNADELHDISRAAAGFDSYVATKNPGSSWLWAHANVRPRPSCRFLGMTGGV